MVDGRRPGSTLGAMFADRVDRVRARMQELDVQVLLLSVGPELPYLTGYEAMPLERLTMLVLPADGDATLLVPRLEAPRVVDRPDVFALESWDETDDPLERAAELVGGATAVAVGDRMWARFLVDLLPRVSVDRWVRGNDVVGPIRAVKDAGEIEALRAAGAAADRVAVQLQSGQIPLRGRTEAEVSADIGRRLIDEGHHKVNFAIVAAGPNAASPHHEPGSTVIQDGQAVLCDFGGTMHGPEGVGLLLGHDPGRCRRQRSRRARRCVRRAARRPASSRRRRRASAPRASPSTASPASTSSTPAGASGSSTAPATASASRSTRTPTSSRATPHRSPPGHAFSVEPGMYLPGPWGIRLEDIVVATEDGPAGAATAPTTASLVVDA